jgi:hypothetical protein
VGRCDLESGHGPHKNQYGLVSAVRAAINGSEAVTILQSYDAIAAPDERSHNKEPKLACRSLIDEYGGSNAASRVDRSIGDRNPHQMHQNQHDSDRDTGKTDGRLDIGRAQYGETRKNVNTTSATKAAVRL